MRRDVALSRFFGRAATVVFALTAFAVAAPLAKGLEAGPRAFQTA